MERREPLWACDWSIRSRGIAREEGGHWVQDEQYFSFFQVRQSTTNAKSHASWSRFTVHCPISIISTHYIRLVNTSVCITGCCQTEFLCTHVWSLEQFSNGITIISLYLNPLPNSHAAPIEHSIFQVTKEASLLYCLPDNPFFLSNDQSGHAVQEATYACTFNFENPVPDLYADSVLCADCGWIFAQHFCNRLGPAYLQLRNVLDETNPAHAEVLNDIKRRFREETFTRESIEHCIHAHPDLVCYILK